jgi:hypothetical protein
VILAKEGGHKALSNRALDKIMVQTHGVLKKMASGEAFDPTLAITDDIFHDNLPEEYNYLKPDGSSADGSAAPSGNLHPH